MKLTADRLLEMVSQNNAYAYQYSKSRNIYKIDSNAREVSDDAAALRKTMKKLSGYDKGSSTKDTVKKQLEKFTREYNTMLKNEDKVEDKNYHKNLEKLKALVKENRFKLKKIGFAYDESSKKYKFDTDKFQKAGNSELESVLSKEGSFMVNAQKLVKNIRKAAGNHINVTEKQTHIGTIQLEGEEVLTGYAAANSVTILSNMRKITQSNVMNEDINLYMNESLSGYADMMNTFIKNSSHSGANDLIGQYIDLYNEYSDDLQQIGFGKETGEDGNMTKVTYTAQDFHSASAEQMDKAKQLFGGGENSFGVKTETLARQIFSKAMKLDTSGIVVDQYA